MAQSKIQRPRGTRDFGPDEMAVRLRAAEQLRGVFKRFGYHEIGTPTFEELELFTAKSGMGIISELYNFQDKGERDMTLRPELTAPVMRMYFQDHAFDPKPIKWFYHGSCFRYDRPQTGRYREFWQFGCEQIGAGTPLAYAELIALGDACLAEIGVKERDLAVGHVGLLGRLVARLGLDDAQRAQLMRLIDKVDKEGVDPVNAFVQANASEPGAHDWFQALWNPRDAVQARTQFAWAKDDNEIQSYLDELEQVFEALAQLGVQARLNLGIARGLDYYTGVVFEVHSPALGAQSQLLGGGGYDLSAVFGGQPTPTMGFGLGFDRTLVALEAEGTDLGVADGPVAYLGALSDAAQEFILALARDARAHGLAIDMDLLGRKPGQIAKHADAIRARFLVVLGDRDLESGRVQVKELAGGAQHDVALDELRSFLAASGEGASAPADETA